MDGAVEVELKCQHLTLLPQRAVLWQEQKMLIIADAHFGKAAAFRRGGIAIPGGTTADDLKRLDQILASTGASTLLVLGDLMHAAVHTGGGLCRLISRWRQRLTALRILLVSGNHDRKAGPPPADFGIQQIVDRYANPPFCFMHHAGYLAGSYVLGGHLHPAVRLTGAGRQRERLPCFYFGRNYAVLPAYGGFTGNFTVRPQKGERVFVIADNHVIEPHTA